MFFEEQVILKDFEIILDFIERSEKLELSATNEWLGSKDLLKLHEKLHFQSKFVPERCNQAHFGVLNTLLEIAKTARLFEVSAHKSKKILVPNPERIQMYREMSKAEQYFALLESWWCFLSWKQVYDTHGFYSQDMYEFLIQQKPGVTLTINDHDLKRKGTLMLGGQVFPLIVFEAFGLFKLNWDAQVQTKPKSSFICPYESVTLDSKDGILTLKTLILERPRHKWGNQDSTMTKEMREEMGGTEAIEAKLINLLLQAKSKMEGKPNVPKLERPLDHPFASAFKRAFPRLKVTKSLYPIQIVYQPGLYHLRISLYDLCKFEVAVADTVSLYRLHMIIQKLVKFDNDHMFAFYPKGKESNASGDFYVSEPGLLGEGKAVDMFTLGQMSLYVGQKMLYVFDFGDNWQFKIDVLGIDHNAKPKKDYELLKSTGKPPKQYGRWD
jgi:Plasmid pRiA4b ORF-3-like protein